MAIFLILSAAVFLLSCMKPRSKVIMAVQLIMMWLLLGWNSGGIDFLGNESIYYVMSGQKKFTGFSSGWFSNMIAYFGHQHDLTFIGYNIVTTFCAMLIIGLILYYESEKPCIVLNLFLIYPFVDSIIQKRFFLGMVFILLGLFLLMKEKRMWFFVCVAIAIGFHFSFYFYIPLFFVTKIKERNFRYYVAAFLIVESFILFSGLNLLEKILDTRKVELYMSVSNFSSWFVSIAFVITTIGYIYIINKICCILEQTKDVIFLKQINIAFAVIIPLLYFDAIFLRFYSVVLILAFIIITNQLKKPLIKRFKLNLSKQNQWFLLLIAYFLVLNILIYSMGEGGASGFLETMLTNQLLS